MRAADADADAVVDTHVDVDGGVHGRVQIVAIRCVRDGRCRS